MTEWLNEWLKDIVLIILVATFVDLLIPNNSLGRYVKVVISLIILLTIMSPIIAFLKEDIVVNQALEQASGSGNGSRALNLILADGAKMKSEIDHSSTLLAEQQVGKMIQENLESSLSVLVQEVTVTILEEEGVGPSIQHIQVFLSIPGNSESDNKTTSSERKVSIDHITPVTVAVGLEDTVVVKESTNQDQAERTPSQLKLEEQVINQLVEQWGLTGNGIQVEWR